MIKSISTRADARFAKKKCLADWLRGIRPVIRAQGKNGRDWRFRMNGGPDAPFLQTGALRAAFVLAESYIGWITDFKPSPDVKLRFFSRFRSGGEQVFNATQAR